MWPVFQVQVKVVELLIIASCVINIWIICSASEGQSLLDFLLIMGYVFRCVLVSEKKPQETF